MIQVERPKFMTEQAVLRADVWDASDKHCAYCGIELHPLRNFCVDHVTPKCAGGTDDMSNLVAACRACNQHKGTTEDRALCRRLNGSKAGQPKGLAVKGDMVIAYRARHGLSQNQLAKQVGLSHTIIRRAEAGEGLRLSTVVRIAKVMRVDHMKLIAR